MAFADGTLSFKRLYVLGEAQARVDEPLLKRLADHAFGADTLRTADHTELGWTTGEHLLDARFDFAKNALADGLHFALRVDTHRPPADLVRGYQKLAEEAMLEASGRAFLTRAERKEAREQARARADAEARAGAFLRSRAVPAFWDLKRNEVYLAATAPGLVDQLILLFRRTFDRSLSAATAGELASRWAAMAGETRALDDALPAHFINPPDGAAAFSAAGASAKDFLGTEFLIWLLYAADVGSSEIATPQGHSAAIVFEKALQLQCPFRLTGTVSIAADGPAELPETAVALATGKLPVKAGMQLAVQGEAYALTLRPDVMNFSGVRLPEPTEPTHPRARFEERIEHLRDLIGVVDGMYATFLKRRLSNKWPATLTAMRAWIAAGRGGSRPVEPLTAAAS
ncbi:MAG: hypothetical protein AMXMBFR83_30450 [Phycisphaerae bacterium]